MGQNKFEIQIREKLNSREIQPSAQAWDRLDAVLSVSEGKKSRRPFGFLFIAASILVLLAVGLFFFTKNDSQIRPKDDVVTSEIKDTVEKSVNEKPTPSAEQKEVIVLTESQSPESQITNSNDHRVSINNQKTPNSNQQSINQSPLINREKEIEFQINSDVALKNLPAIEIKKDIIFTNKSIPSDEQLLASLDKTAQQSSKKNTGVKISPKSLLSQVDGELELSFREKIINKISKNYKEVKVALSNRNNE